MGDAWIKYRSLHLLCRKWNTTVKTTQLTCTLTWHSCILEWQNQKQDCKKTSSPTLHTLLRTITSHAYTQVEALTHLHYVIHKHMWQFCERTFFCISTLLCISLTLTHSFIHNTHLHAQLHSTLTPLGLSHFSNLIKFHDLVIFTPSCDLVNANANEIWRRQCVLIREVLSYNDLSHSSALMIKVICVILGV